MRLEKKPFFDMLKLSSAYFKRDRYGHLLLWGLVGIVYLIDLLAAWGGPMTYEKYEKSHYFFLTHPLTGEITSKLLSLMDGLFVWVFTIISCIISVYFFSLRKVDTILFKAFDGEKELSYKEVLVKIISVIWRITAYSAFASFIGFLFAFFVYKQSVLELVWNKDYTFYNWQNTNFLLWNTGLMFESNIGGNTIFYDILHVLAAILRSWPESFMASFVFAFYESIKVLNPINNRKIQIKKEAELANMKIKEEELFIQKLNEENARSQFELKKAIAQRQKIQLEKEEMELRIMFLNQEDWFHFATNIFTGAITVIENIEKADNKSLSKADKERLLTFLRELADLTKFKHAHSLEKHIPLVDELKAVKSLKNILKHRVPEFHFDLNEMEEDHPKEIRVLPGILYEFIWNAYKHSEGASYRFANVYLNVDRHNTLIFTIVNSFPSPTSHIPKNEHGRGLEIAKKRLDLLTEKTGIIYRLPPPKTELNINRIIGEVNHTFNTYEINFSVNLSTLK